MPSWIHWFPEETVLLSLRFIGSQSTQTDIWISLLIMILNTKLAWPQSLCFGQLAYLAAMNAEHRKLTTSEPR